MIRKFVLDLENGDVLTRRSNGEKCAMIGRTLAPFSAFHFHGFNVGLECMNKFFKGEKNRMEVE